MGVTKGEKRVKDKKEERRYEEKREGVRTGGSKR